MRHQHHRRGVVTGNIYQRTCAILHHLSTRAESANSYISISSCKPLLVIESAFNNPRKAPDSLTLVHLRHLELSGDLPFMSKAESSLAPNTTCDQAQNCDVRVVRACRGRRNLLRGTRRIHCKRMYARDANTHFGVIASSQIGDVELHC